MKTKSLFLFCFVFFCQLHLLAQDFFIEGPSQVCPGDCAEYYMVDSNGIQVGGFLEWYGPIGAVQQGPTATYCFVSPGTYSLFVYDPNNQIEDTYSIEVTNFFQPEIIAVSGAYCSDNSSPGGTNSCDAVCANTTITYTTEVSNPTQQITWTVSGAESYTVNGNEVTVTWGDPGNGEVSVEVGSLVPYDWTMSCGSSQPAAQGGLDGTGFVFIDGPPDFYQMDLSNGMSLGGSPGFNEINNLSSGSYSVTVTCSTGNTAECTFSVFESDVSCAPGEVVLYQFPPSDCNSCDGSIFAEILGNLTPPFAYQWTGPNGFVTTTSELINACPGTYTLWLTDSNGCTYLSSTELGCGTPSSCTGYNSICIDILAIPEAQFETTPPAVNGIVEICEGQTVFFENQTTGASTYTWDFGNGISSSEVEAEHTYLYSGTYQVMLIARNDCFCSDTTFISINVQDAISPEIDCAGTVCPDTEVTYTSDSDCTIFNWNISPNGTIISGGNTTDNFITVDWGVGPEGLIELSVDGCTGDYCLETMFEVIPIIDDNALIRGLQKVCKGEEAIYSITAFAGTDFNWSTSPFGTITDGQGTNEITVQWAEFPIQDQWVAVNYESCYLGCGGDDIRYVDILNEFFIEGPIEACNNENTIFTSRTPELSNNEAPANWTIYDDTGATIMTSGSATANFPVNWNFGSGTFTVHAEADNPADYCVDNYSIFVEIPPETAAPLLINGPSTICPGQAYTYSALSSGGPFQYTWYVSNGGTNSIMQGKTVNITWGASPPYHIDLTQTNTEGLACESSEISLDMQTINAVSVTGTDMLCHEEIGTYTATSFQNIDYTWQITPSDAGTVISGSSSNQVQIQWHLAGTFDVQVSVCGQTDITSTTVHSRPNPSVNFDLPCPGQSTAVQTTLAYTAYQWKNESGFTLSTSPSINLTSGYYEVIVTDANGCTQNESFYIGTLATPEITISTPDLGTFCQLGGSMTLYTLETSSGFDYQWYHDGNPVGGNTSSITVSQEGVYYVEVTNVNGCEGVSNSLGLNCVILQGPPNPGCVPGGFMDFLNTPGTYCNTSQYTNTSVNDISGSWYWSFFDFGAGTEGNSTLENPAYTYQTAGFHLVTLEGLVTTIPPGGACPSFTFQFDTVPLAANFAFEPGCAGDPLPFTDLSTYIPQTNITGWSWNFDDPSSGGFNTSSLQNPVHSFSSGGNYFVTLTVTDQSACISQMTLAVQVENPPLASFTLPESGCEGTTLPFNALGSFTDASWNFGDPASGAANTSDIADTWHEFDTPGTYTITLTTSNIYGCEASSSQQITILNNSLSGIVNINPTNEICEGDSTILTAPAADTYLWSAGETSQSITVFEAGLYEVTIFDESGCEYTPPAVQIDVIPLPQGQITAVEYNEFGQPVEYYYNNYETCYGEDVYLEITENPNYTYQWSTGEATTDISFTEDKDNLLGVGTHDFTLTLTDVTTGCTNVIGPFTVTVHPVPEGILITSSPPMPVCENTPTLFQVSNPDPTYTYVWNTGELGTSITSFYAGEYFVRAINEFGCEGESNRLEITPGPNVDLIPQGCHSRCNPDTICLPDINGVASFQWYLDGVAISAPEGNVSDYIATESGEYHVEMVSTNGCVTISDFLTLDLFDGFGSIQGNVWFDINNNGIIDGPDTLMSGIPVILKNSGTNLDTLVSNQNGSIAFSNIFSTDYELLIDILNLPSGLQAIIAQASSTLVGCDDEDAVEFLIQFNCINTTGSETLTACEGDFVLYNGDNLPAGSVNEYIFTTPEGCDSTVTVTVTELSESTSDVNLQACDGSTVNYNGTPLPGGSVTDFVFTNSIGCDSIVTVNVAISDLDSVPLNLSTCTGEFVDYNGNQLAPGTQTDYYYSNQNGCDSVVTVIVAELQESVFTLQLEACEGTSINFNGTDIIAGTSADFILTNAVGCDSTLTVEVAELFESTGTEMLEACQGTSINFNGTDIPAGTSANFILTNEAGCDSILTVEVAELFESTGTEMLEACQGTSIIFNGTDIPAGTSADFILTNEAGCDSILTVEVAELFESTGTEMLEACEGSTVNYNGSDLDPGSVTDFTLTNAVGCDSVVTVTVMEILPSSFGVDLEACTGSTATYNGDDLPAGSSTDYTFTAANGCDSVVTVLVAELLSNTFILPLEACEGSSVDYNGNDLPAGSSTNFVYTNQAGCDSTITVEVATLMNTNSGVELTACEGQAATYNGTGIDAGETMDFTFSASNGCDSVVTVAVIPLSLFNTDVDLTACEGTTTEYNGDQLPAGSVTNYIFTSSQGCDSTVTVSVESLSESSFDLTLGACENGTATYNGQDLPPGSTSDFIFENAEGCDSIVTVTVASLPTNIVNLELFACVDESVEYNGEELVLGTNEEYIFENQYGCDSIVQVSVSAYPDFEFELASIESCWNAAEGAITIESITGGTAPFMFSINGKDFQPAILFDGIEPGDYEVFVQDANGCINTQLLTVESITPMVVVAENEVITCELGTTVIQPEVFVDDPFAITFLWPDGSTEPFLEVDSAGTYMLSVSNSCETIMQAIEVQLEEDPRESFIFVPNVFSPNGDGMNDLFEVYPAGDIEILSFELKVFDRWGNTLDHFPDTGDSWDGTFRDKNMNPGVFVWYYKAEVVACGRTISLSKKGDVTLVR